MDPEEKKRIAAEAKRRAQAEAAKPGVKASPTGAVKSVGETAKERAKAELANGPALRDTSIEAPPGMLRSAYNAVGRFMTDTFGGELPQEGDWDYKLENPTVGTDFMMDPVGSLGRTVLNTGLGAIDTLQNRDERTGKTTRLNTALNSALDVGTIGTANTMRGAIDYVDAVDGYQALSEVDPETTEAYAADAAEEPKSFAEYVDRRALEQEEIRAANPGTAIGTDMLTAVLTGGGLAKGAYKLLEKGAGKAVAANIGRNWAGRILFGSSVGSAEVFAYRMNKEGDLEKAAKDASLAMLGGVAIGGLFETARGLKNIIRNTKAPDIIEEAVGDEIISMINIERQTQGLPAARPSDIMAEIAKMGPDATLMDLYPSLRKFAEHVLKNADSADAGKGLREIISLRKDLLQDLIGPDGTLRTAFGSKSVRGESQFFADMKARQTALQPRYKAVTDANTAMRFDAKQIKDNLLTLFGGAKERLSVGQMELIDFISANLDNYIAAGIKKTKGGKVTPKGVTLDNMLDLRVVLGKQTGSKAAAVATKGGQISLDNVDYRDLAQVSGYLSDLIHLKAPELIPLDKVYGNLGKSKTAYKAGLDMFTGRMVDSADVQRFMAEPVKSAAERRAFTEGAKYRIFKLLNGAKTADGIDRILLENRELLSRMEAMFGADGLKQMIDDVRPQIVKLKTKEVLGKAVENMAIHGPDKANASIGRTIDVGIAIGGIPGWASKAGMLGGLRRLAGQAVDPAEMAQKREMFGDVLSQMGTGAANKYKHLNDILSRSIRPSDMGAVTRPAALGAATERYVNQDEDSDGALPQ